MSYILDIARIAENKESTREAISIAISSMQTIDKLKVEGNNDHLTTAITTVISGILQPPIGQIVSVQEKHVGTILTFPANLTNYAADTMTGWYIALDRIETDVPEIIKHLHEQCTSEDERRQFKTELLKHLNSILPKVTVTDVCIIPDVWLDESTTPVSRVTVTIILDPKSTTKVREDADDDGEFSIVDDEHVQ